MPGPVGEYVEAIKTVKRAAGDSVEAQMARDELNGNYLSRRNQDVEPREALGAAVEDVLDILNEKHMEEEDRIDKAHEKKMEEKYGIILLERLNRSGETVEAFKGRHPDEKSKWNTRQT